MIKRANKITSLLIAATAVVSLIPASAADVKKIDAVEGTIYSAAIDTNGAYIDGDISGNEDAYYESNGKFTALDIDSGMDFATHKKYVRFDDGDYTLDLSTGKVVDEDTWNNYVDDAAEAVHKNIKDDTEDRYDKNDTKVIRTSDDDNVKGIGGAGDWYKTTYTNVDSDCVNKAEMPTLTVYSDQDGNYIDADYNLGKVKVTTTDAAGKSYDTTIDNTNEAFDVDDSAKDTISAYVTNQNVVDMDNDYFYRTATVTINSTAGITKINGKAIAGTVFDTGSDTSISFDVVQKISKKASSNKINGAPYANSVITYVVCDKDGEAGSDYDVINNSNSQARVADGGKLSSFYTDSSKTSDNVVVRTYTLKGSNGFYYLDTADTSTSTEDAEIDGDGNVAFVKNGSSLYRLDSGYIYKYNNDGDWNKLYKVDGSFDDFVVNSDTNMIAWSEDDEVYSIISETSATADGQTTNTETASTSETTTTTAVTVGWTKASNGTWNYVKADGTKATGWLKDGISWYYLNTDGSMVTGWVKDNGTWYYLKDNGTMTTGWINDNGSWYYCNASGAMLSDTTVDGYELGSNGAWIK